MPNTKEIPRVRIPGTEQRSERLEHGGTEIGGKFGVKKVKSGTCEGNVDAGVARGRFTTEARRHREGRVSSAGFEMR